MHGGEKIIALEVGTLAYQENIILQGAPFSQIAKTANLPIVGGNDAAAGLLSWANPESQAILITRAALYVSTASTGACTVNLGGAATSVASSNLMNAFNVAAAGAASNLSAPGTNGKADQLLAVNQFVTLSTNTGASAGLAGSVIIEYVLLP